VDSLVPVRADISNVIAISSHTDISVCALTATREVWCWGDNEHGQIGDGTVVTDHVSPVRVTGLP